MRIYPMKKKEKAKKLQQAIFQATKATQKPVYELWKCEGFKALGYNSFKDWAKANQDKFNRSYDSINNDLHTALITVDMCGEENIGKFNTYALLPMKNLSEQECKAVYEHALSELGVNELKSNHLTHKRVKEYMDVLNLSVQKKPDDNNQNDTMKEASKSELSSGQLKRKRSFSSALNNSDSPYFAQRVCIAISNTIPKKSTLRICRDLLELHGYECAAKAIRKAIKQLESK